MLRNRNFDECLVALKDEFTDLLCEHGAGLFQTDVYLRWDDMELTTYSDFGDVLLITIGDSGPFIHGWYEIAHHDYDEYVKDMRGSDDNGDDGSEADDEDVMSFDAFWCEMVYNNMYDFSNVMSDFDAAVTRAWKERLEEEDNSFHILRMPDINIDLMLEHHKNTSVYDLLTLLMMDFEHLFYIGEVGDKIVDIAGDAALACGFIRDSMCDTTTPRKKLSPESAYLLFHESAWPTFISYDYDAQLEEYEQYDAQDLIEQLAVDLAHEMQKHKLSDPDEEDLTKWLLPAHNAVRLVWYKMVQEKEKAENAF